MSLVASDIDFISGYLYADLFLARKTLFILSAFLMVISH